MRGHLDHLGARGFNLLFLQFRLQPQFGDFEFRHGLVAHQLLLAAQFVRGDGQSPTRPSNRASAIRTACASRSASSRQTSSPAEGWIVLVLILENMKQRDGTATDRARGACRS